jgi:hypothetical protein
VCIDENIGDSQAQGKCTTDIKNKCGTLDPAKAEIGGGDSSSSSTSGAPSGTPSPTTGGEAAASTTVPAGAMPTAIGNGIAAVAAGLLAAALL